MSFWFSPSNPPPAGMSIDNLLTKWYGHNYPLRFSQGSHFLKSGYQSNENGVICNDDDPNFRIYCRDLPWAAHGLWYDSKSGRFTSLQKGISGSFVEREKGELYAEWVTKSGIVRGESSTWPNGAARVHTVTLCDASGRSPRSEMSRGLGSGSGSGSAGGEGLIDESQGFQSLSPGSRDSDAPTPDPTRINPDTLQFEQHRWWVCPPFGSAQLDPEHHKSQEELPIQRRT